MLASHLSWTFGLFATALFCILQKYTNSQMNCALLVILCGPRFLWNFYIFQVFQRNCGVSCNKNFCSIKIKFNFLQVSWVQTNRQTIERWWHSTGWQIIANNRCEKSNAQHTKRSEKSRKITKNPDASKYCPTSSKLSSSCSWYLLCIQYFTSIWWMTKYMIRSNKLTVFNCKNSSTFFFCLSAFWHQFAILHGSFGSFIVKCLDCLTLHLVKTQNSTAMFKMAKQRIRNWHNEARRRRHSLKWYWKIIQICYRKLNVFLVGRTLRDGIAACFCCRSV